MDLVVDYDGSYLSIGKTPKERQAAYAQYVCDTVPEGETRLIREALQRGQLTGSDRFSQKVSKRLGIRISNIAILLPFAQ
jgi:putative transposase